MSNTRKYRCTSGHEFELPREGGRAAMICDERVEVEEAERLGLNIDYALGWTYCTAQVLPADDLTRGRDIAEILSELRSLKRQEDELRSELQALRTAGPSELSREQVEKMLDRIQLNSRTRGEIQVFASILRQGGTAEQIAELAQRKHGPADIRYMVREFCKRKGVPIPRNAEVQR